MTITEIVEREVTKVSPGVEDIVNAAYLPAQLNDRAWLTARIERYTRTVSLAVAKAVVERSTQDLRYALMSRGVSASVIDDAFDAVRSLLSAGGERKEGV